MITTVLMKHVGVYPCQSQRSHIPQTKGHRVISPHPAPTPWDVVFIDYGLVRNQATATVFLPAHLPYQHQVGLPYASLLW